MEYWHSLGSLKTTNTALKLQNPRDFVLLSLNVLELIITWGNCEDSTKVTPPFLFIDTERLNRAFIVKGNQIVSFAFPFSIYSRVDDDGKHLFCVNYRDIVLSPEIISKAMSFAKSLDLDKSSYAAQVQGVDFRDSSMKSAIRLFEQILSLEPSYIRYDYDKQSSNGTMHPLYHFDVNYNKNYTYKIGLYRNLEVSKMREVLDQNSDSWYTKPYSLISKIEQIIVEKWKEKKS